MVISETLFIGSFMLLAIYGILVLLENYTKKDTSKFCCNAHITYCRNIGSINRFEVEKQYCCYCYIITNHKKEYNPNFSIKNYCTPCKNESKLFEIE